MNRFSKIFAAASFLVLTGCDAIKVPGIVPEEELAETPTESEMADAEGDPAAPTLTSIESLSEIAAATCGITTEVTDETESPSAGEDASSEVSGEEEAETSGLARSEPAAIEPALAENLDLYPGLVKLAPIRYRKNGDMSISHCGAVRIADNWFLTAASCLEAGFDEIRLVAGTTNLREMSSAQIFNGNAGWASASAGLLSGEDLLTTSLSLLGVDPSVILAAAAEDQSPCAGDIGGALYATESDGLRRVVGVMAGPTHKSETAICAGGATGRFLRLESYQDWIDTVFTYCDTYPDLCETPLPQQD